MVESKVPCRKMVEDSTVGPYIRLQYCIVI